MSYSVTLFIVFYQLVFCCECMSQQLASAYPGSLSFAVGTLSVCLQPRPLAQEAPPLPLSPPHLAPYTIPTSHSFHWTGAHHQSPCLLYCPITTKPALCPAGQTFYQRHMGSSSTCRPARGSEAARVERILCETRPVHCVRWQCPGVWFQWQHILLGGSMSLGEISKQLAQMAFFTGLPLIYYTWLCHARNFG